MNVTLGDVSYDVPKMNIGQIEELSLLDLPPARWTYAVLRIVMKRAVPQVPDLNEIEATPQQIRDAVEAVLQASGYKISSPNQVAPDQTPGQIPAAS